MKRPPVATVVASVRIDPDTAAEISVLAEAGNRSFSRQCAVLLDDAVKAKVDD